MAGDLQKLAQVLREDETGVLDQWLGLQRQAGQIGPGRISEGELRTQCRDVLAALSKALTADGAGDVDGPAFEPLRALLDGLSQSRAAQGFGPTDTARFVFSLKEPLFERLRSEDADGAAHDAWAMSQLVDRLGMLTMEAYQRGREQVIRRQQDEISELSTPVVKLWDGILALPLIGTLDSGRTQVVMENLLQSIVDEGAEIAIIDITGVPTVDTLVAQHLLKTIAAARLMGADCIVSGIRPQIAQTMVHLGVDLNVVSKATLADALAVALKRVGKAVVAVRAIQA